MGRRDAAAGRSAARRAPRAGRAAGAIPALAGLLLAIWLAELTPLGDSLDRAAFDAQARIARSLRDPAGAAGEGAQVVIVGIDDASLDALGVPLAMIHASLGGALEAIAAAEPRIVGVDLALPAQSFDPLAPGLDRALMAGLLALRRHGGVVLALDSDAAGRLRVPALAMLAAAGGPRAFGLPLFPIDCDGIVRRFDPDPGWQAAAHGCDGRSRKRPSQAPPAPGAGAEGAPPTFAGRIAWRLGREALLSRGGWIDFTRGAAFDYVGLREVIDWGRRADAEQLRRHFGGKVVLVGSVLPHLDRMRLPVALAGWNPPDAGVPGLVVNAQVLRNALGPGLLLPAPALAGWLAAAMLAALALVARPGLRAALWVAGVAALLAGGLALHAAGWFLGPSQALLAGTCAVALRSASDGVRDRRERRRMTELFGAYLSPQVLGTLLRDPRGSAGTRRAVALLFADLRDFTAWSERADPALVLQTLNRYYAAITPLLHARGGTIDNFRGDGVMVMFGAPEPADEPCGAAFESAREIVAAVEHFNAQEAAGGRQAIAVTVGLAFGEVVFGELGSADRKDYTALGDAVNVAARLQDLAKRLGCAVLMTEEFAARLPPGTAGIRGLGLQAIKGHSPVAVCAWRAADAPAPRALS